MITEEQTNRIKEIIKIANHLGWINPSPNPGEYPIMQLSEVEKCMFALIDDVELKRMRLWFEGKNTNI